MVRKNKTSFGRSVEGTFVKYIDRDSEVSKYK